MMKTYGFTVFLYNYNNDNLMQQDILVQSKFYIAAKIKAKNKIKEMYPEYTLCDIKKYLISEIKIINKAIDIIKKENQ